MTSDDVNRYLREAAGADVTARDFRIWSATVLAYRSLCEQAPATDARAARRNVVEAVRRSAGELGNTPAVARQSYVHPGVLEAYLDGAMSGSRRRSGAGSGRRRARAAVEADEAAAISLLRGALERDARRRSQPRMSPAFGGRGSSG